LVNSEGVVEEVLTFPTTTADDEERLSFGVVLTGLTHSRRRLFRSDMWTESTSLESRVMWSPSEYFLLRAEEVDELPPDDGGWPSPLDINRESCESIEE